MYASRRPRSFFTPATVRNRPDLPRTGRPGRCAAGGSAPGVVQRDLAARRDRGGAVRAGLPGDAAVGVLTEVLVLERGARGQRDGALPHRVARGRQGDGAGRGPVAERRLV